MVKTVRERRMIMANRRYITIETAPELFGKTVGCFRGKFYYYPLRVIQMGEDGCYFVVDRNNVAMSVNENERIPYDFIVKEIE